MIARNKPGRNEPCPCGSGKKYKLCCGSAAAEEIGKLQMQLTHQRILAHLFLSQLLKVTGASFIGVSKETLNGYPMDAKMYIRRDTVMEVMQFSTEPLDGPKKLLVPQKKIQLPQRPL